MAGAAWTTSPTRRTCTSAAACPLGLWCRGPLRLDEAVEQAVAVVGSRSATTYGGAVAGEIAAALARESWTVVSGAAFGIDQAAHRGALASRGPTVAVLACGVDRAYPTAHRSLIDYIADVGSGGLGGGARAVRRPASGSWPATG